MFKPKPVLPKFLLLVWLGCQAVSAVSALPFQATSISQQATPTLEPGRNIEREIAAGETHVYEISLAADQFVEFNCEQGELRGVLRLLDPAGKVLSAYDALAANEPLRVRAITASTGQYRVEFRAFRNQPARRYKLNWTAYRAPTERDLLNQEIERVEAAGLNYARNGQYAEAAASYERMLVLTRPLITERALGAVIALNRLGTAAKSLGEFARAESAFKEALQLAEQRLAPQDPELVAALEGLAQLYLFYGADYKLAASYLQRAIIIKEKIYGAQHLLYGDALRQVGDLYFAARAYDQAEPWYRRALAIFEKQMPDNAGIASPLSMLGKIKHARGHYEQAEIDLQRCLALREKDYGRDHPVTAQAIFALGKLAQDRGQLSAAVDYYQRAYQILARSRGPEHVNTIEALEALAQLGQIQNDVSAAFSYQTKALAAAQRSLRALLSIGSEQQRRNFLALYRHQTDALLSLHLRLAPSDKTVQDLAATTLLQRKGLAQETFANTLANLRRRIDPGAQRTLDQWQTVSAQLARLVLDGPAPRMSAAEYQQQIDALTQQRDQLESELSRRSAGSFQPARAVTLAEIQKAIPPNAALLEFAVYRPFDPKAPTYGEQYGAPRYVAYVIRAQGAVAWRELGDAASLETTINAWRAALRDRKRAGTARLARAVSAQLWQPLQPLLNGVEHLLIAPDGLLNLIPFAALPDAAGRYLIERYAISYLSSGRDLLRLQTSAPAPASAPLVIADPLFGEPGALTHAPANPVAQTVALQGRRSVTTGGELNEVYFAPLFGSAQEAHTIKTLFHEATVLTGAQATEAALKQVNAPRLLHIATHGFFLADTDKRPTANVNPLLRSGLALAQANLRKQNTEGEDGILTALEAAGLNLWGTRLVTLSACDTGLGEVRNGEGVYGLRRAFALAGAETLLMSLWPVSDLVTRELMTVYYINLQRGQGRGAALRTAQLQLLKRSDRRAPYYWASFIQAGEWGNLSGQR
jgi:CHAT domain-containing protein